jgi:ATP-dependent DNA helicase RecG
MKPAEPLQTSIAYLKGVGPGRAEALGKELGIFTCADLLNFFPFRYIDRSRFFKISELLPNFSEVQLIGTITGFKTVQQKRGSRLTATFTDSTGTMELVWFKGMKWIKDSIKLNTPYVIFGKANPFQGSYSMPHPEMELLSDYEGSLRTAMQPVYRSTEKLAARGITNRVIQRCIQQIINSMEGEFQETLSEDILKRYRFVSKGDAMFNIHFPKSHESLLAAQQRLKFEELFFIQLQLIRKKLIRNTRFKGNKFEAVGELFNTFYKDYLPFSLTEAQKKVVKEIRKDLGSGAQMNRLLQGDVGSGKTMVALMLMLIALDNRFQTAMIAPTEILATQHYTTLKALLEFLPVRVSLLTGSTKAGERKEIHNSLEDGSLHILVGTHAIFEEKVQFANLGLVVIDEQHKFGVAQRAKMWEKNHLPPHILVMTATPIPRTLAMSVYGDLDVSVIDELPPGRKSIKTIHRFDKNRLAVFQFLKEEIGKGRQVYIVYPLIEESSQLDYKDLMDGFESIVREFPAPKYQVSIVHGRMKNTDKDFEMDRFVRGETQIMVATTVIEVGVNVPNASVMVIESAERFGLSQLHQLRGRVGRGAEQSFCILMTGSKLSEEAKTRMHTMVNSNDGFEIAEVDLKLRGPGDLSGTQQSGVLNLKIADLIKDGQLLFLARNIAIEVLKEDPDLALPKNKPLAITYQKIITNRENWANIS